MGNPLSRREALKFGAYAIAPELYHREGGMQGTQQYCS